MNNIIFVDIIRTFSLLNAGLSQDSSSFTELKWVIYHLLKKIFELRPQKIILFTEKVAVMNKRIVIG